MSKMELQPVYTTARFEDAGLKLVYDEGTDMYIYKTEDQEIGEGYTSTVRNEWAISRRMAEQYLYEGALSYIDPNKKVEEPKEEESQCCDPEFCGTNCNECTPDCDEDVQVNHVVDLVELSDKVDSLASKVNELLTYFKEPKEVKNVKKAKK